MQIQIDWVSVKFYLPGIPKFATRYDPRDMLQMAINSVWEETPTLGITMEAIGVNFVPTHPRRMFNVVFKSNMGFSIMMNEQLSYFMLEIEGTGCNWLHRENYTWYETLAEKINDVTRIDVAVDWKKKVDPREFVDASERKFRTRDDKVSLTGTTVYCGSKTSERFCRVYMYNEPHERANTLRCEMVQRKKQAGIALQAILDHGMKDAALKIGQIYKWRHPLWEQIEGYDRDMSKLPLFTPDQRRGDTMRWLTVTAMGTLRRLIIEGVIADPEAYIEKNVFTSEIKDVINKRKSSDK